MTVTLSYDTVLSRVQVTANALGGTQEAIVERSTDGVRWTTIRGYRARVIAGSIAVPVDDYEFPVGKPIQYRVRAVDTSPASFVDVGAGSSGSAGSRTPALPAGIITGDLLLVLASTRNSGVGTPDTPAGWEWIAGGGNLRLYARLWDGVFGDPTITFTGGAADEDTIAQVAAFRNVAPSPHTGAVQQNASPGSNIAFAGQPALAQLGMLVVYIGWRASPWTSVDNITDGYTVEISEVTSTAGNGAGQVWDYYLPASRAPINPGSFVVDGGTAEISRGGTIALQHNDNAIVQTATITVPLGQVWLKSISRPFLNRPVDTRLASSMSVTRRSRATLMPVVARPTPVAVSSVRASKEWTMLIRTDTEEDKDNTDLLLASGDVLLVQAPPESGVETGYVSVGDATRTAHPLRPMSWLHTLPMTEVAAPAAEIVGASGTWQTVLDTYPTWAAVIAAHPTWADLLTLIGDPSEVYVP